ncbi:hypothetical protein D3C72_2042180 [compost metagenome]
MLRAVARSAEAWVVAAPLMVNCEISSRSLAASLARAAEAAFDSSTMAAFCCVTWSIWLTAWLTSERPVDCSLAEIAMASI